MTEANFYPLFVSLARKICVICGYGKVGFRKLSGLKGAFPAAIRVYDPTPFEELDEERKNLIAETKADYICGICAETDLEGVFLVFAAAADKNYNRWLASVCEKRNILCDCVAPGSAGDCLIPAVARANPLVAAISSSGASPALAKTTRKELEEWLKPRARLARLLGALRDPVKEAISSEEERSAFFRDLATSPREIWSVKANNELCLDWLSTKLPGLSRERLSAIIERIQDV